MEKSHVIVILAPACGRLEDFRDISFSLEQHVRRLHYFIGLLEEGHRQALEHDPLPPSFRADRLALGIDVPELDVVPFWSETADDGAVPIPFIEFVIAQIIWSIEGVAGEAGPSGPVSPDGLALAREALGAVLERADPGGAATAPDLPRLRDVFLPRGIVEGLFGPGGLLQVISGQCEALVAAKRILDDNPPSSGPLRPAQHAP